MIESSKFFTIVLCILLIFSSSGCATTWRNQGAFQRTTQTVLIVGGESSGEIYVDNKLVGQTPIKIPLEYGQEVEKSTRKVSYWRTKPGLTLFLSLVSLGCYLPFSFVPVDQDTSLKSTDSFTGNEFNVEIKSEGHKTFTKKIVCRGEETINLNTIFER